VADRDDTPSNILDLTGRDCDGDRVTCPVELTRDEIALVRIEAQVDQDGWDQPPRLLWVDAAREQAHEVRLPPAWWREAPEITLAGAAVVLSRRLDLVPEADAWALVWEGTRVMCDEDGHEHSDRVRMADMATSDDQVLRIVRPQALAAFEDAVTLVAADRREPRVRVLLALARR
jgi:hypothetical protein